MVVVVSAVVDVVGSVVGVVDVVELGNGRVVFGDVIETGGISVGDGVPVVGAAVGDGAVGPLPDVVAGAVSGMVNVTAEAGGAGSGAAGVTWTPATVGGGLVVDDCS